jgi:hypothetical protein
MESLREYRLYEDLHGHHAAMRHVGGVIWWANDDKLSVLLESGTYEVLEKMRDAAVLFVLTASFSRRQNVPSWFHLRDRALDVFIGRHGEQTARMMMIGF